MSQFQKMQHCWEKQRSSITDPVNPRAWQDSHLTLGSPISFIFFLTFTVPETEMSVSKPLIVAAAFAAAIFAMPSEAGVGIEVTMNQAKIVKLPRAADTVVVGNSAIADAAVQDASTIVLTGKGFGVTNLVALDRQGSPILDEQITVVRQGATSVRIYRRSQVQTMSCTPYCESATKTEAEKVSETEMNAGQ